jgi:hypothetical protein
MQRSEAPAHFDRLAGATTMQALAARILFADSNGLIARSENRNDYKVSANRLITFWRKSRAEPNLHKLPKVHLFLAAFYILYSVFHLRQFGLGEILASGVFCATFLIGRYLFHTDLSGMLITGMLAGLLLEWTTEVYWQYHLSIYIWRDVSLYVVLGWGYNFTYLTLLSDSAYRKFRGISRLDGSMGILLCDGLIGIVFFVANEFIGMRLLHLWDYNPIADWTHIIPFLGYPIEGVFGALLLAMVFPSFVRHWEMRFRISPAPPP